MRSTRSRMRLVRPTPVSSIAALATLAVIIGTAAFLVSSYPTLPDLLPVRFNLRGRAIGWQYKTSLRVLVPSLVQAALAMTLGAVGTLLLSRTHKSGDDKTPDMVAATTAVEAIALVCFVWVAFQAYAAAALVQMWQTGRGGLGQLYSWLTAAGIVLTIAVGFRAHRSLGRPEPRQFVAEHWRFGQLYNNPSDPALFVPTRDGSRWTLNFGRPVAAALLAVALLVGVVAPTIILAVLLRM